MVILSGYLSPSPYWSMMYFSVSSSSLSEEKQNWFWCTTPSAPLANRDWSMFWKPKDWSPLLPSTRERLCPQMPQSISRL